jgi:hypothetical protein
MAMESSLIAATRATSSQNPEDRIMSSETADDVGEPLLVLVDKDGNYGDGGDHDGDNQDHQQTSAAAAAKAAATTISSSATSSIKKWKNKKFLMTRDVATLIRNHDPSAPHKAQEMIRRMWALYHKTTGESVSVSVSDSDSQSITQSQDYEYLKPDAASYNLWINALAKSGSTSASRNSGNNSNGNGNNKSNNKSPTTANNAAVQAEQVLQEMVERGVRPNVVTYTSVMDAYAQQSAHDPTAAASAERLLFDFVDSTVTLTTESKNDNDKVSSVTADTVLNAWAQQGTEQGAARAEQILQRLQDMATTSDSSTSSSGRGTRSGSSIRPTAFSYATVIHGWAQVGGTQGAERAQAVLDGLLQRLVAAKKKKNSRGAKSTVQGEAHPDTVVFNAVMHAWANSGDPAAGSKAALLLNQMQELHVLAKYDCAPDTVSFNTVLSAWSHGGHMNAAMQAERILQEMVTANRLAPDQAPAPNAVSYNSVLHAWSKSQLPGAANRAEAVLEFMIRSSKKNPEIAPDVYSFTSVLNALAKSKEPNKAQRARARLDQLLEMYAVSRDASLRPSQVTFNTVLNGCKYV